MWTPSTNESIKPLAEAKFRCLSEGKLKKIQVLIAKQTLPMRIPSNASDGQLHDHSLHYHGNPGNEDYIKPRQ